MAGVIAGRSFPRRLNSRGRRPMRRLGQYFILARGGGGEVAGGSADAQWDLRAVGSGEEKRVSKRR